MSNALHLIHRLKALDLFYRTAHWKSKGLTFMQDHLLFADLYAGLDLEVDTLVELMRSNKTINDRDISPRVLNKSIHDVLPADGINNAENFKIALEVEKAVVDLIAGVTTAEVSVGVYNHIAGISQTHEKKIYLISSRLEA